MPFRIATWTGGAGVAYQSRQISQQGIVADGDIKMHGLDGCVPEYNSEFDIMQYITTEKKII